MFWITLRQHMEEKAKAKQRTVATGILQPFSISAMTQGQSDIMARHMSLATSEPVQQSPSIAWLTMVVRQLLVKYWIWMVASMLMVMSLGGQRVVIYRVVYMFIFLSFVLMFQVRYTDLYYRNTFLRFGFRSISYISSFFVHTFIRTSPVFLPPMEKFHVYFLVERYCVFNGSSHSDLYLSVRKLFFLLGIVFTYQPKTVSV